MKTKYLFCKCVDQITRDTLFVDVYVGSSRQDQRDCDYFRELAKFTDILFERYDADVTRFLFQVGVSLGNRPGTMCSWPRHCSMSVHKLRKLFRLSDYDRFAATFVQVTNRLSLRFSANDTYAIAMSRASEVSCNAAHVKNLKPARIAV